MHAKAKKYLKKISGPVNCLSAKLPAITTVMVVFSLISFSSCLTAKKMDKWIDKRYEGVVPAKIKSSDYMTIKTENLSSKDHASNSQKGDNKLLPAFFYWQWKFST